MKIICNRQILSEALINVSKAVSSKSTIHVLEGILITAEKDCLSLSGYNLDMAITTTLDAQVFLPGKIVLSARLFTDIVRKIEGDEISVTVQSNFITEIKGEHTEFSLSGLDPQEYPELPSSEGDPITEISTHSFKTMIEQTSFAVATSDLKPIHTGILFEVEERSLSLIAVDGFRLALKKEPILQGLPSQFVVPHKPLSEISKFIKEDESSIMVFKNEKSVIFKLYNYTIISRLLEGEFLDYQKIIQFPHGSSVIVSRRQFLQSIDRASLIINDRIKSPVILEFLGKQKIITSCKTAIGQVFDEVPCTLTGDELKIGFNHKYMIDALRACHEDEIQLHMNGSLSPLKISPLEGEDFLFLVLPVRF